MWLARNIDGVALVFFPRSRRARDGFIRFERLATFSLLLSDLASHLAGCLRSPMNLWGAERYCSHHPIRLFLRLAPRKFGQALYPYGSLQVGVRGAEGCAEETRKAKWIEGFEMQYVRFGLFHTIFCATYG